MGNKSNFDKTSRGKTSHRRKRRRISARLLWCLLIPAAVAFFIVFWRLPMFPRRWSWYLLGILLVMLGITGYFSFTAKYKNIAIRIINVVLTAVLVAASIWMPRVETQVTEVIETNNDVTKNTVKVNLYVLTDEYKAAHPETFPDFVMPEPAEEEEETVDESAEPVKEDAEGTEETVEPDLAEELKTAYADKIFITQISVDTVYQQQTVAQIEEIVGNDNLLLIDRSSILDAAAALYSDEGQVLIMTSAYASMVENSDSYDTFLEDTRVLYTVELPEEVNEIQISNADLTIKPFSVFFGGNDEEGDLNLSGRTDVDMVVTVNPNTHQIVITSFPRDSFVPNPALGYAGDKLTHLGVNGLDNTLSGLSNILETEIDNYIIINFTTYRYIIDALGGVDVDNPYEFWADDGEFFEQGVIHLGGDPALMYVRERHHLPDGDFGRNMHQQLVMQAIIRKLASPEIIVHFEGILQALKGTFLTNLSSESIYAFCKKQFDENIKWNIVTYRALGELSMSACASAGVNELSVVLPYQNHVDLMVNAIDEVYAGNIIEQQELPEGEGIYLYPVAGVPYEVWANEGTVVEEPVYTEEPVEIVTPEPVITEQPAETEVPVEPAEPEQPTEPEQPVEPVDPGAGG